MLRGPYMDIVAGNFTASPSGINDQAEISQFLHAAGYVIYGDAERRFYLLIRPCAAHIPKVVKYGPLASGEVWIDFL